jgi:hypothetical protein
LKEFISFINYYYYNYKNISLLLSLVSLSFLLLVDKKFSFVIFSFKGFEVVCPSLKLKKQLLEPFLDRIIFCELLILISLILSL